MTNDDDRVLPYQESPNGVASAIWGFIIVTLCFIAVLILCAVYAIFMVLG